MTEATAVGGIEGVLRQCGVTDTTLAPREKDALDRVGYIVLHDVIDRDWLARLREAFASALARGGRHGAHVHLTWDDAAFDGIYTQPRVLAAVYHVLRRPFKTFPPVGRDPLPGFGQQGLHADWPRLAPSEPYHVVTVLWLLDDFAADNGATRVIPGSHRWPKPLPKPLQQPDRLPPRREAHRGGGRLGAAVQRAPVAQRHAQPVGPFASGVAVSVPRAGRGSPGRNPARPAGTVTNGRSLPAGGRTRMTKAEWNIATDPAGMIDWLEEQGYGEPLWDFAIACCHRIWDELPGDAFRGVIEHVEQVGTSAFVARAQNLRTRTVHSCLACEFVLSFSRAASHEVTVLSDVIEAAKPRRPPVSHSSPVCRRYSN